jgi:hypothetical protein
VDPSTRRRHWPGTRFLVALVSVLPLLVPVYVLGSWASTIARSPDPLQTIRLDWYAYFVAARKFINGDFASIYPPAEMENIWMYPPYCLYAATPLAFMSDATAYAACLLTALVTQVLACLFLGASIERKVDHRFAAMAVVAASMPFNMTIILGQASGPLLLAIAAAIWTWRRGLDGVAGFLFGLVAAKPNLGLVLPVLCVVARRWRVLAGFCVAWGTMLIATIPLGAEIWRRYYAGAEALLRYTQSGVPMWKQVTLYAFLRTALPAGLTSERLLGPLWTVGTVTLACATAAVWSRRGAVDRPPVLRLVGLAMLLAITANAYAYYYDSVLLAVPGIAWFLARDEYVLRGSRVVIGGCIAGILVLGYPTVLVIKGGVAWTGGLASIWLLAEAHDLWRGSAGRAELR